MICRVKISFYNLGADIREKEIATHRVPRLQNQQPVARIPPRNKTPFATRAVMEAKNPTDLRSMTTDPEIGERGLGRNLHVTSTPANDLDPETQRRLVAEKGRVTVILIVVRIKTGSETGEIYRMRETINPETRIG